MFEFMRFDINTLHGRLTRGRMEELAALGRAGWQIKAAIRGLTGNTEVLYLERKLEDVAGS